MGVKIETTYSAVLAPFHPSVKLETPPEVRKAVLRARKGSADQVAARMLQANPIITWCLENIPGTLIEPDTSTGDALIVATFASDTDAAAFKTRWG